MGLQRYKADYSGLRQKNGSLPFYSGHNLDSIVLIRNCPVDNPAISPRTVYIREDGEWSFGRYSGIAAITYCKKTIKGYVSTNGNGYVFHPYLSAPFTPLESK